jgi:O-antigen/teichoic acid export membrane protein
MNLINKIKRLIPKGTFIHNVTTLAGGTLLGQGVMVLTLPLLTRLYTPDDLGEFALFITFVNVATVGGSLLYESGIISAENEQDAAYLTILSIVIAILITPLMVAIFATLINFNFLGFGSLSSADILWMPVVFLTTVLFQPLRYWLIRNSLFGLISKITVTQNVVKSLVQIGLGLVSIGWLGLLIGDFIGRGFGLGRMFRRSREHLTQLILPFSLKKIFLVGYRYSEFPIYSLPSSLLDILSISLVVPMITQMYGITSGGYFLLAQRTLAIPTTLISNSVADAFHNQIALYACNQPLKVKSFFLETAKTLTLIGLIPSLGLALLSPYLFSSIFGTAWEQSGWLVTIVAPWSLAGLIVSPLSRLVFVFGGQKWKLFYDIIVMILVILSFSFAYIFKLNLPELVSLLSGSNVVAYGLYFMILLRITHQITDTRTSI